MKEWSAVRTITALKTPYLRDGTIDYKTFRRFISLQIESSIDGVVIAGTTGEGHLLEAEELIKLITVAKDAAYGKLKIIGNTGSLSTQKAVSLTKAGFAVGMHASLQVNPYYGRTSQQGRLAHFRAVLDCGPAILYNVPQRTNSDILADEVMNLSTHPNFIGIKECAGIERMRLYANSGIRCWSGNDEQAYIARHELGCTGTICIAGNLLPALMSKLMANNDPLLDVRLKPLFQWLSCEPNPIPVNTALMLVQAIEPVFKLPYVPLSPDQQKLGIELLSSFASYNPYKQPEPVQFLIL